MSALAPQPTAFEESLAAYPEHRCETGAGVVSWRESGVGPALVLLHGISSGSASWIHQLEGLQTDARVVAWNAPGYGASSALANRTPLASDYARSLAQLVEALSLQSITLVGHSLGALMAAAYTHANPGRVRRLVLMSPACGYALADPAERERRYGDRIAKLARLGPEGMARERAAALVSPSAPGETVEWIAWNMRRLHPDGYRQAAWMLANDDIGSYAAGHAEPVVVYSGEADNVTPVDRCKAVAALFPNAEYTAASGLGHALYLEDPTNVNAFLREQVGGGMTRATTEGQVTDGRQ